MSAPLPPGSALPNKEVADRKQQATSSQKRHRRVGGERHRGGAEEPYESGREVEMLRKKPFWGLNLMIAAMFLLVACQTSGGTASSGAPTAAPGGGPPAGVKQ